MQQRRKGGLNSRVYKSAHRRLDADPTLALGLNCCAVTARRPRLACPRCGRVLYAAPVHMLTDRAAHAA